MFVEIMGLQMNTDKLNAAAKRAKAAKKADTSNASSDSKIIGKDDDEFEVDSLPDLEMTMPPSSSPSSRGGIASASSSTSALQDNLHPPPPPPGCSLVVGDPVTGRDGIPPFEWEVLERVAIEDALEQEERARKSHSRHKDKDGKSSSKGLSSYPPFYPGAASYSTGAGSGGAAGSSSSKSGGGATALSAKPTAAELARKKHRKDVQTWKAQVIATVQGSTPEKLGQVLQESPLDLKNPDDRVVLEQLVPYCVGTKNRKRKESRDALTEWIARQRPGLLVLDATGASRNGRSVLHSACYEADTKVLRSILPMIPEHDLSATCSDSGLTPLMYACLSGSLECIELLLENKADPRDVTNPMQTWQKDDVGLTTCQLLECILKVPGCKSMETHGMAMEEVSKKMAGSREYAATLESMRSRLADVDWNGYTPRSPEQIEKEVTRIRESARREEDEEIKKKDAIGSDGPVRDAETAVEEEAVEENEEDSKVDTVSSSVTDSRRPALRDPLVVALLGMGFAEDQITSGIRACGGVNRATADDVVAWIFGGQEAPPALDTEEPEVILSPPPPLLQAEQPPEKASAKSKSKTRSKAQAEKKNQEAARKAEEERIAAEKLAAKREEQRRRNREWNNRAQVRQLQEDLSKVAAGDGAVGEAAQIPVGMVPPSANYFPQAQTGPTAPASAPRLKTGVPGLSLTHLPSYGPGVALNSQVNDTATIASSIDVEFGNDDATVSTLGSMQTRATPVPFGSQPPKLASQVVPPGFNPAIQQQLHSGLTSDQLLSTAEANSRPTASGSAFAPPSSSVIPPPGIPESHPLIMESSRLPSSAFSSHSFGIGQAPLATAQESRSGASAGLGGAGLLSGLTQPSTSHELPSLFSTGPGVANLAPSPVPSLPLPPGYGVNRLQSTPASFAVCSPGLVASPGEESVRSTVTPQLRGPNLSVPSPSFVGSISLGASVGSQLSGVMSFGRETHQHFGNPLSVQQHQQQQLQQQNAPHHHQQHLEASIIDSISTSDAVLPGTSLWGDHHQGSASAVGGSSLLGNLISSDLDSGKQSSLFANPQPLPPQQLNLSEGLWGNSSNGSFEKAPGRGSIW
jgi:hypothetical protein